MKPVEAVQAATVRAAELLGLSDRIGSLEGGRLADVVAIDVGVDDGPLLKSNDGGAHEKGHEGQAHAVTLLECGLQLAAQVHDAGEVDLIHAVNVSAGAAGLDHVLGDQPAHVRHGD